MRRQIRCKPNEGRTRMISHGEDRTAQRQRGSMTKRRHVGRKETANRRTEYPAGKPTDRQTDPAERRSGVGRATVGRRLVAEARHIGRPRATKNNRHRLRRTYTKRKTTAGRRSANAGLSPIGDRRHTSDSSRRQRTRFEETLNANRRHVLPPHERRRPMKAKSERQETYLPAAVRNFFKTDHTSYFLILKNGVVKRRFFVIKNNFRPAKAPTHVGLFRIFSPFIFR